MLIQPTSGCDNGPSIARSWHPEPALGCLCHTFRCGRGLNSIGEQQQQNRSSQRHPKFTPGTPCRCWLCRPRHQCAGDEGASQRSYRISLRSTSHIWPAIDVREHPPGSTRRTTPYTICANVPLNLRMDACPDRLSRVLIEQQQDRSSAPKKSSRPNVADQPVHRGGSRPEAAIH